MRVNANNPYVGLRAFETDESILFFGRNDQTMELLQRLHKHHFVAVVGSSGSGKSSLLRAGLIPSLKAGFLVDDSDHWVIAIMKPGQSPLYNMTESLLCQVNPDVSSNEIALFVEKIKEEGAKVLLDRLETVRKNKNINFFLLVDQFEELFRFAIEQKGMSNKDEAIDFVNILLELTRQEQVPVFVVITMRSDFIGDCAHFNGLPEAMNESLYLVPRLNRVQMKLVIEGPAKLYGRRIDTALTSRLLNELGKVQDELPLLQHTLMRIWGNESGKETDVAFNLQDYEFVGGIERALLKHADEALIGMNESSLLLTKKIFQSLTAIDGNGRKIRRPAYLSELKELTAKGEKEIMGVIDLFVKDHRSFLVINNDMTRKDKIIDISHESLIRQWDTLGGWVDEEEGSAAEYLQLTESANLNRQRKKDLLKGSELNIALEWFDQFKPTFAWAKKYNNEFKESIDYLKASENALIKERMIESANSRRKKRIMISAFIFLSGLTAIAVFTAINFIRLKNQAESTTLIFAARNVLEKDPTEALSMVNESMLKHFDSASYKFLLNIYSENSFYKILVNKEKEITCFSYSRNGNLILTSTVDSLLQLYDLNGKPVHQFKVNRIINTAIISPDGKLILTGSGDSTVLLWNVKGDMLQEFKGHSKAIRSVAFSPDGRSVLAGAADNSAVLWDLKGKVLAELKGHNGTVYSVAFSSDGNKILTGSADSTAYLWDLKGNIIQKFIGHTDAIHTVSFSPDDTKIVTGSEDNTARVWELNGQMILNYQNHKGEINSVSFSPDGKTILSGSVDRTANLWDLTGNTLQQFKGHNNVISAVAFTKDGKNVLTGSIDSTVRIWSLKGNVVKEFSEKQGAINSVVFSHSGKTILIGSSNQVASLWDEGGNMLMQFIGHTGAINTIAFSPDEKAILTGSADSTIRIWNIKGQLLQSFKSATTGINAIAYSPDGRSFISGCGDSIVRLWDIHGNLLKELKGHAHGAIMSVAFSPDGKTILTGSFDNTARLWDLNGKTLQVFKGHSKRINSVAFSPDGKTILSGSGDNTAILWDLRGNTIRQYTGHEYPLKSVAFSPDGKTILTGSGDQTVRIWDLYGNMLYQFKGHSDEVNSVAFSPNGKRILTGSGDQSARIWEIPLSAKDFISSEKFEKINFKEK